EPTGNLDSVAGSRILDLLLELNARGATIAVITHDREVADRLGRRVFLRDGRIEHDRLTGPAAASPGLGDAAPAGPGGPSPVLGDAAPAGPGGPAEGAELVPGRTA
ncbi:MAG TPA: hypothetical protein VGF00_01530, partial [Acidimicrobiia bacterium]